MRQNFHGSRYHNFNWLFTTLKHSPIDGIGILFSVTLSYYEHHFTTMQWAHYDEILGSRSSV